MAFAARKWEMSAVVMGEKMMTGIAKKISGYNLQVGLLGLYFTDIQCFMESMKIQSKYSGNKNDDSFQKNDDTKC